MTPDLPYVDLVAHPELEPDLGPTPESIEQGHEPADALPRTYAVDPLNPTDAELSAAIDRGLADGTLIDAADWLAANASGFEREPELEP